MAEQPGFFDANERLQALSAVGGALERLKPAVDLELFRPDLEAARHRADTGSSELHSLGGPVAMEMPRPTLAVE